MNCTCGYSQPKPRIEIQTFKGASSIFFITVDIFFFPFLFSFIFCMLFFSLFLLIDYYLRVPDHHNTPHKYTYTVSLFCLFTHAYKLRLHVLERLFRKGSISSKPYPFFALHPSKKKKCREKRISWNLVNALGKPQHPPKLPNPSWFRNLQS